MPDISKFFGPPGTGKTEKLISIVSELLALGILPFEIIYCSFTTVAAGEAMRRALEYFPQYGENDFKYFSTVHSICFRLLGLHRSDVFSTKQLNKFGKMYHYDFTPQEGTDPLAQTIQDMAIITIADYYEALCSYWKNTMMSLDGAITTYTKGIPPFGFSREGFETYMKRRDAYKQENKLFDFPDMLLEVLKGDLCPPGIKVLFLDESQDFFPLLWDVIKMWVKKVERVYMAADPYQTIFSWSGASPSLFINFPADKTLTLKQSHRCPREVHDLSRRIVGRFKTKYKDDDYIPRDADGRITNTIDFDLTEKPTFWLFRTRYLLNQTYDYLNLCGIPFMTRRGKKNIFDAKKERKRRVVVNLIRLPEKSIMLSDLENIMDFIPSKVGKVTLIERGSKKMVSDDVKIDPNRTVSWQDLFYLGFTPEFMSHTGTSLLELLVGKEFPEKSYIRSVVDKYGVSVLQKKPNLELGTFHSSKGDEAARVIIDPTLTRKPFNNFVNGNEEEHRLIYVAVTRSSNQVVTLLPSKNTFYPL